MADHGDHDHEHGRDESPYATERVTAPQSAYTIRDVAVGAGIAAVGMVIVFAIPLVLA